MRKSYLPLLAVLVLVAAACSSSDASEQIEGVWENPADGAYVEFDEDGQYQVATNPEVEGPFELGDYTFDGETLTYHTASDSQSCPGTSATWTVAFSNDGDQADLAFVEDSCVGSARSTDSVWIR